MIFTLGDWCIIQGIRQVFPQNKPSGIQDQLNAISRNSTLHLFNMLDTAPSLNHYIAFQYRWMYN